MNTKQMLETFYADMLKKFKHSAKMWLQVAHYHYRNDAAETARQLMQRSLKCLPKHKRSFIFLSFFCKDSV